MIRFLRESDASNPFNRLEQHGAALKYLFRLWFSLLSRSSLLTSPPSPSKIIGKPPPHRPHLLSPFSYLRFSWKASACNKLLKKETIENTNSLKLMDKPAQKTGEKQRKSGNRAEQWQQQKET
jgi:hypothetical protein